MSRIDGLQLQGIRSFAPGHRESISLYTPLTLIVGYNGSGKTTIIECLKYVTTGDLPPNSKNGAFIHDPKARNSPLHHPLSFVTRLTRSIVQLCNETTVLANVGVKFTSLDGKQHVVHRKLQCKIEKSGKRTYKSLESSWKEEGEERSTTSPRVQNINAELSRLLGVAPAILDSVIFCHQDESLWPMSEPNVLKKKFDEIFDAQKWTKGVDVVKMSRKRQGIELRAKLLELGQQEQDKKKALANSRAINELEAEIVKLGEEERALEREADMTEEKTRQKREEANQFLGIINDLSNLQTQFGIREDTVKELRDSIDMLAEDDDELKKVLDQYGVTLDRLQKQVQADVVEYNQLEEEIGETRTKLNDRLAEKGRLESDKEKYERQLESRVEMVQHAAVKHGLRGFTSDLDDHQISVFNEKIQAVLNNKKREHERLQNELARAADEAGAKISELEGKKSSLMSERQFAKQKRTENDRKIKRLQTDADAVDCDEGHVKILEKNKIALDERYQNAQKDMRESSWDDKIQGARSELNVLEKTSEELNTELVNCTRLSSERAQLDLRKKEMKEREGNLESLVATYSGRISGLLKRDFNIGSLESDYKVVHGEQAVIVKNAKARCDALQKELDQRDFELTETRKRQAASLDTKARYERTIMKVLKEVSQTPDKVVIEDFTEELESLEDAKSDADKTLALFDEMKNYYNLAQTYLNTKNKCKLCQRGFTDDQSKAKIEAQIKKGLSDEQKKALEQEVCVVEEQLAKLTAVRSDHDALQRLKSDLSKTRKDGDIAQTKREEKLRQLEAAEEEHSKVSELLNELESVSKSVSDIAQLNAHIQDAREQIGRLESQSQMSGTGRSADEIQNAQSENSEKLKEVKKNLDNLTRERQRNLDLISNLELERSDNKNKLSQAKHQMEVKGALARDVKGLREDNQKQDESVAKIDQDLKALQPQIDAARGQRDAERERGREKARAVAEERDAVAQTLSNLKIIEDEIQDYLDRGKASALASAERVISGLKQQHDRLQTEMGEIMTRINSQKQELAQGDRRKKNINDNLRYRENCRTLDSLSKQIEELEAHNAREDYDKLMSEAKYYSDEWNIVRNRISTIRGTVGAKDESLKALLANHNTFYKGVEEKYKRTKMDVEATKCAIDDLGTFGNAMNQAIMEFHSLKMEEVNRIAGELWRATYQGTDIDTIAIRSENEAPAANSKTDRRQYNYRVTMVKQDTEMDMRGRCSAGQKVLASIIIRLALAESFGVNCGLIALDEPTTNLDSDNIRSLAVSLHGIIKARQAQANFQLIVITHDEEFLRHMRCNEFTDKFYRVKRDVNQCSVISKEDISRITD